MRLAWLLACFVSLAACSMADAGSDSVTVFGAVSLMDPFQELGRELEETGVVDRVELSFAGSQQLAVQIQDGAPADLFASADAHQMEVVEQAGLVEEGPILFARNTLAIAVQPGNPREIGALADLARPGLVVVLAAENVPAGRYARLALERAGVSVAASSLESDVRAVLAKVALGEADAGIVYRSELIQAGEGVEGVQIPPEHNVQAEYWIADIGRRSGPARAFLDLLVSSRGAAVLERFGFEGP